MTRPALVESAVFARLSGMNTTKANNPCRVLPHIYVVETIALGPGKIDLLRLIYQIRSSAVVARTLKIHYKYTWLLIDRPYQGFGQSIVRKSSGNGYF